MLPEEEKEWTTISVALIFTMTLNSNSGLEFNVVEFTKEHSNILAGAIILVLAGALVVNAILSIIAFFITNEKKIFIFKTTDMESDELIKIIKTTGILFEKKKNHLIFISIVKKEKVFKNKQRMVDLSSF